MGLALAHFFLHSKCEGKSKIDPLDANQLYYTKGAVPTRASKPKRPRDPNQLAHSVVQDLIGERMDGTPLDRPLVLDTRNPAAVALSKLGASKGGLARAASLSDRKRKMIARKAAEARWGK